MPFEESHHSFEECLVAAKTGDGQATNELFTLAYPHVSQIVHRGLAKDARMGRHWLLARFSTGDVVQEVFWSLMGSLDSFRGSTEQGFHGYLALIVRNRILDAIRFHEAEMRDGRRSESVEYDSDYLSPERSPLEAALNAERSEGYQAALETLPERDQLLIRARIDDIGTFEELAEQLGYSHEAAARRAYYRSTAELAVRIQSHLEGD